MYSREVADSRVAAEKVQRREARRAEKVQAKGQSEHHEKGQSAPVHPSSHAIPAPADTSRQAAKHGEWWWWCAMVRGVRVTLAKPDGRAY